MTPADRQLLGFALGVVLGWWARVVAAPVVKGRVLAWETTAWLRVRERT